MGRAARWVLLAVSLIAPGVAWVSAPAPAHAATGSGSNIDRTYGSQGVAAFGWTEGTDAVQPHGLVFQSNGSMVALVGNHGFVRVTAAGAVDPGFASRANGPFLYAAVLGVDPQDRIVTAEHVFQQEGWLRVRRFLSDGTPDPAFGASGVVTWPDAGLGSSQVGGVVADSAGRVLILYLRGTGSLAPQDCVVARFSTTGQLDTGYGTGGLAVIDVPRTQSYSNSCHQLLLRSDDGVYVGTGTGTVRLDSTGTQLAFGEPGATHSTRVLGPDSIVLPAGQIASVTGHESAEDWRVSDGLGIQVLTAAGRLDATFSGDGVDSRSVRALDKNVSSGYSVRSGWIGRRPDGRLVVGGIGSGGAAVLIRWNANGAIDTTYGEGGVVYVRESELPSNQSFGLLGALSPDGTPHQLVQPNTSWAFSRGIARIGGSAVTSNLQATADRSSGPEGTVVRIVGSGCPGTQLRVGTQIDGSIADGKFDTTFRPTIDNTFDVTVAIGPEPMYGTRADHTYPLTISCPATGRTATAGQFRYTAAGSLWQTIRLKPLHPGETTVVNAVSDGDQAVGRSGDHAVWWDGAGNPYDLGTHADCTGEAFALNDASSAVGTISCPDRDWNQAFDMSPWGSNGAFPLPADLRPNAIAASGSIYRPTTVVGTRTVSGVGHASVADSDGAMSMLPDAGLPSRANAISDAGYIVGTIDGLDTLAAGMPPHLAVGWIGGQLFPLIANPATTEGIDVNEAAYALVQVTTPGNDRGVLVAPGGAVTSLNSDGLSDHVVDLNDWNFAVGRRRTGSTTYAGIFYVYGQGIRLDTLVSASDRATWTYDHPTGTNNQLWVVGNTGAGTSWLMRTPGT